MKLMEAQRLAQFFITIYQFSILIDSNGNRAVIFRQTINEPYRIVSNHEVMMMAISEQSYYSNLRVDELSKVRKEIERLVLHL